MAIFLFMLPPDTERFVWEKILSHLTLQFPEHEFEFATAGAVDLENVIFPVADKRTIMPDQLEIDRVQEAFGRLLANSTGWKGS